MTDKVSYICYMFILSFRSISNLGISLDARYTYEMRGKKLTVRKNEHYVERLWPDGVVSLAAVVGSNGAGKTTFLEGILHMLAEGSGEKEVPSIIIYEHKGML